MKRKFIVRLLIFTLVLFSFGACKKEISVTVDPTQIGVEFIREEDGELLAAVVSVKNANLEKGTTLADVMEELKDERTFTYTFSQGMLTELNGKKNGEGYYWMLYTSDDERANTAWGTYLYEGQALGSATVGAESLPAKDGEVYVWAYQSF